MHELPRNQKQEETQHVLPREHEHRQRIRYADDDRMPVKRLIEMRIPSLLIGLSLGVILSFIMSGFEGTLSRNIQIVFFLPFIVYIADAVGAQTRDIYVRDLKGGKARFITYLVKETLIGIALGILSGAIIGTVAWFWLGASATALAVALGTIGAVIVAPPVALIIAEILELEHRDPAVGAGPIATIIQDTLSVVIYGLIATAIIL